MPEHRTVVQVLDIVRNFLSLTPEAREDFCSIGAGLICEIFPITQESTEIIGSIKGYESYIFYVTANGQRYFGSMKFLEASSGKN